MRAVLHGATILGLLAIVSGADMARAAEAGALQVSGELLAGSDYVYRGVSQSQRKPVLQIDVEVAHRSGVYVGGFASNVDYTGAGVASDGIDREYSFRAGWRTSVGDVATLDLSAARAMYPGADDDAGVDYTEYAAALGLGEHLTVRVAHAPDYYRLGGSTTDAGVDLAWSFDAADLWVAAGHVDQQELAGAGYRYLDVTLSRYIGRLRLDAGWARAFGYSEALAEINGDARLARGHARIGLAFEF